MYSDCEQRNQIASMIKEAQIKVATTFLIGTKLNPLVLIKQNFKILIIKCCVLINLRNILFT